MAHIVASASQVMTMGFDGYDAMRFNVPVPVYAGLCANMANSRFSLGNEKRKQLELSRSRGWACEIQ